MHGHPLPLRPPHFEKSDGYDTAILYLQNITACPNKNLTIFARKI